MRNRNLNNDPGKTADPTVLSFRDHGGNGFIRMETVVHCSAKSGCCTLYLNNGNIHDVNESLKSVEEKLPSHQFIRLHHSHIVNIAFINRYVDGTKPHVVLHNGSIINVSAQGRKRFEGLLNTLH